MKYLFSFLSLLFTITLISQDDASWVRYSNISPDGQSIAFVHKGDIYIIPSKGGEAKAITYHDQHDYMPVWSPDSKQIAFASNRHGNFDLFLVAAEGGEPKRLTYHSYNQIPMTFSGDGKEIFFNALMIDDVKHRQHPHRSQHETYKVSTEGGRVNQVFTIPTEDLIIAEGGTKMYYTDKKGGEDTWRKHHQSSVTRDIWMYDANSGKHKTITTFKGEDRDPELSSDGTKLFYLSEKNGSFNVHRIPVADYSSEKQVTNFDTHPVRFLSSSNDGKLCFTHHGILYTMDMKDGSTPQKVDITVFTGRKQNDIKSQGLKASEMAISPDGKEVVYTVRGEVFVSGVKTGLTKRITNTPEKESFVSFSPDGKSIIYASERNSHWSIFKTTKIRDDEPYFFASTLLKEELVLGGDGEFYQPQYSPDGKELAYIKDRRFLNIYNFETKATRTLLTPEDLFYMSDGDQDFTWSPDSKWMLVDWPKFLHNSEILLLSADGKQRHNLTESGYQDSSPKWVNEGKQLLWFSDRDGMRAYAKSGRTQSDVYTMFFTQEGWDKSNLSKVEYDLMKELEKEAKKKKDGDKDKKDDKKKKKDKDKDKKDKKEEVKDLVFDMDGLEDRKKRLTIHSSSLRDALLSKDGEKLYYLTRFEKGLNLWSTNLRTKETKMEIKLNAGWASLQWDKKQEKMFLLSSGSISTIDPKTMKKESVKLQGKMTYNQLDERKHLFDHVWNRTQDMFYISDFHGIDWDEMRKAYEPKLESIDNDFEFSEILGEMLGELNVSHSGARFRGSVKDADKTAALGIFHDYSYTGDGLKIAEVIKGGPIDKKKLGIKAGMIIEEIDGVKITPNVNHYEVLNQKSGKYVSLLVKDMTTGKSEYKTVKPISTGAENRLLYKRWVKQNQDDVERLSNGTLAYVHVPGMGDGPYRTIFEDVLGKYVDRDALILDTRFNGGGDLVSDLSMFLTGKKYLDYAIESRSVGYEPTFRWTKPSIAMVNESNYSDGHCFAFAYKELEIGKMLGMPVPGTCSFAGWEMLQNGTVLYGAVPVSARDMDGKWMENYQTEPDIIIKNDPNQISNGVDQQLARAVQELMKK